MAVGEALAGLLHLPLIEEEAEACAGIQAVPGGEGGAQGAPTGGLNTHPSLAAPYSHLEDQHKTNRRWARGSLNPSYLCRRISGLGTDATKDVKRSNLHLYPIPIRRASPRALHPAPAYPRKGTVGDAAGGTEAVGGDRHLRAGTARRRAEQRGAAGTAPRLQPFRSPRRQRFRRSPPAASRCLSPADPHARGREIRSLRAGPTPPRPASTHPRRKSSGPASAMSPAAARRAARRRAGQRPSQAATPNPHAATPAATAARERGPAMPLARPRGAPPPPRRPIGERRDSGPRPLAVPPHSARPLPDGFPP